MQTTPLTAASIATLSINPVENGTNVITATDPVPVWAGAETGLDGWQVSVTAHPVSAAGGGSTGLSQTTMPSIGACNSSTHRCAPRLRLHIGCWERVAAACLRGRPRQ